MGKYIKCPRCELNWIKEEDEYCDVCKAEMGVEGFTLLEDDEEDEMICPYCHVNYLENGEKMCSECRAKKAQDDDITDMFEGEESPSNAEDAGEESKEISFDEIDEGEKLDMYDDAFADQDDFSASDFSDEEEEEDEEIEESDDDLDDDFNYDIDDVDTSDLDDEEEEDEDDEDEDDENEEL